MILRCLKKLNGEKVLQTYNQKTREYENIPMVDESVLDRIVSEINKDKYRGTSLVILISTKASDLLKFQNASLVYPSPTQLYGHRVYVTEMAADFKILKEL